MILRRFIRAAVIDDDVLPGRIGLKANRGVRPAECPGCVKRRHDYRDKLHRLFLRIAPSLDPCRLRRFPRTLESSFGRGTSRAESSRGTKSTESPGATDNVYSIQVL